LAKNIEGEFVLGLIQKLEESEKTYFKKYGVCYSAIYNAKYGDEIPEKKISRLRKALSFIENNNGGNHLSSLLYYNLYRLTNEENFFAQKNKYEAYHYVLTGYLNSESN
jgi:hypothetical protein